MELLSIIEARIGRWLAYADVCVRSEDPIARCQAFWGFVAVVLGIICLIALGGVIVKIVRDKRKGPGSYRRAS